MLEEYIGKTIKIVIGTNSGIGVGTGGVIASGVIVAQGIIEKYDDQFIKLQNVQIIRNNVCDCQVGFGKIPNHSARAEAYASMLVEISKIITIMAE